MTPAARVQSSIELLDAVIAAAVGQGAPADRILAEWFRAHRFAGSKDRRAIRELVFAAIRACGPVPPSGRAALLRLAQAQPELREAFDGSDYGPPPIADEPVAEGGIAPAWLTDRLAASDIVDDEAAALLERAPLDVRVNSLKITREELSLPQPGERTAAPQGLRFAAGTPVERWDAWRDGLIEVQDTGSQLAALAVGARPGETIIDLCAGGGGKTLALAAEMADRGRLIAADTDRGRLQRLPPRAERAGATIIASTLLDPGREFDGLVELAGQADAVLIDAPCSGSGTWRRNPEARWRLTEAQLAKLVGLQAYLLDLGARLLKPGGRLIYVTCSLLEEEGAGQFERFLVRTTALSARPLTLPLGRPRGTGLRLTPLHDATDGFFIACAA